MKIAYIIPSLINQGPVIVVRNLVTELIKVNCQIEVYYFDDSVLLNFPCPVHKILRYQPIDFDKYDIVHSHCIRPDLYLFRWKGKISKAKIVTTIHQDTYKSFRYRYNILASHFLTYFWCHAQSKFDGIISISNQLKNSYESRLKYKIRTIYNGCMIDFNESLENESLNKIKLFSSLGYKVIGSYAYITKRKGLSQIIQSLVILTDYAFVIIGEGPEVDNLKLLSRKLNVDGRVLFISYQKSPYKYLPFFDIYAMPSYSEGFGLAMVESALFNKAIVCSEIPSFNEIFTHDEASFFLLDDTNSLIKAIVNAYEKKKEYGEAAYKKAKEKFTSKTMAKNHLNYYQSLLK